MDSHSNVRLVRSKRALAILGLCATLLLAAVGYSAAGAPAPSGFGAQIIRDPQNPAFTGAAPEPSVEGSSVRTQGLR